MLNYLKGRLKSFVYAFEGIETLMKGTANARIHVLAAIIAVTLGLCLKVSTYEWMAITIVIGAVIALEAVNSAIEELSNLITKEQNKGIKQIKDLAAGAVLVMSVAALIVGLIIFIPKMIDLLS